MGAGAKRFWHKATLDGSDAARGIGSSATEDKKKFSDVSKTLKSKPPGRPDSASRLRRSSSAVGKRSSTHHRSSGGARRSTGGREQSKSGRH